MTALALLHDPLPEIEPGIYFASTPVLIGRNMWRVVVVDSKFGGRRFAYQWHPAGEIAMWEDQKRWPAFDLMANDLGLPASLARLYMANETAIKEALIGWTL